MVSWCWPLDPPLSFEYRHAPIISHLELYTEGLENTDWIMNRKYLLKKFKLDFDNILKSRLTIFKRDEWQNCTQDAQWNGAYTPANKPWESLSFSFRDGFKGLKFIKENCFSLLVFLNHLTYFLLYKVLEDIKFTGQVSFEAHICQKSFVMQYFFLWFIVLWQNTKKDDNFCIYPSFNYPTKHETSIHFLTCASINLPLCFFCKELIQVAGHRMGQKEMRSLSSLGSDLGLTLEHGCSHSRRHCKSLLLFFYWSHNFTLRIPHILVLVCS